MAKECAIFGVEADEAIRTALGLNDMTISSPKPRGYQSHGLDLDAENTHETRIGYGIEREVFMIYGYWKMHRSMQRPSLTDVLFSFEESKCQRWQDRIYGLLGLVRDGENFLVDYAESREGLRERVINAFGVSEEASERYNGYGGDNTQYLKIILDKIIPPIGPSDSTDGRVQAKSLPYA